MIQYLYSPHYRRIAQALVCVTVALYAGSVLAVAPRLDWIDDDMVRYASAFIAVQVAVQIVLVVGLVVSKHVRSIGEERRAKRLRQVEELISRPAAEPEVLEAAGRWPEEFLTVADSALQALAGSSRQRVSELLEASAPYRQLLGDAVDSSPRRAIRAISMLGRVTSEEARRAVRKALDHPAEAVRRAARKAIVAGGDEEARRGVLTHVSALPFWERIILFHVAPPSPTLDDFLAEALTSDRDERVLVALELVLTRQRLVAVPVPAGLAESRNPEVRIKFFRALPFLRLGLDATGERGHEEVLKAGLEDADWRVRALAARACGVLRAEGFAGRLLEMCGKFEDPAEAGHAARALAALGGTGWRRLQSVAAAGEGAGQRILTEVIERRMLGPEGGR